jgi:hypothetical protein
MTSPRNLLLLGAGCCISLLFAGYVARPSTRRAIATKILSQTNHKRKTKNSRKFREDFLNSGLLIPTGANIDPLGSALLDVIIRTAGHKRFDVEPSESDNPMEKNWQNVGEKLPPVKMTIGKKHVKTFVDVDHNLDMESHLARDFVPHLLLTRVPKDAGGTDEDGIYYFQPNGMLHERSTDGEVKIRHLWDWTMDRVTATTFWTTNVYKVDRITMGDKFQLVLLTPEQSWKGVKAWLARFYLGYSPTARWNPVVEDLVKLYILGPTQRISLGRVNSPTHVNMGITQYDTLRRVAELSKLPITIPTVRSYDVDKDDAPLVTAALRMETGNKKTYILNASQSVRTYQYNPSEYDPEAKPALTPYMSPIYDGAYSPAKCVSNDQQAATARVEDLQATLSDEPMTARDLEHLDDFLTEFPSGKSPVDFDEVYATQDRPTQRRILDQAAITGNAKEGIIQSFVKAEAYGLVNDPRMISTINGKDKLDYSCYQYTLSKMLKLYDWYAFGKKPREVAERVAFLAQKSVNLAMTDYSRYDGTISKKMRAFEILFMTHVFHDIYHEELIRLHSAQYGNKCWTTFGVKYNQGYSRASGSPETSGLNSVDNAFVAYCAYRNTIINGRYYTHREAFDALGLYGGDDGLSPNVDGPVHAKTAADWNLKMKVDVIQYGQIGVTFLSRLYSKKVWYGDCNSCCDIKRQCAKIHTTVNLPQTVLPTTRLVEKMRSYYLSDRNTPIIGPLATAVVEASDCTDPEAWAEEDLLRLRRWSTKVPVEDQYPNENDDDWMDEIVIQQFGAMPAEQYVKFFEVKHTLEEFLRVPLAYEPEPIELKNDTPVVVGDEVKGKEPLESEKLKVIPAPPPSSTESGSKRGTSDPKKKRTRRKRPDVKNRKTTPTTTAWKRRVEGDPPKQERAVAPGMVEVISS